MSMTGKKREKTDTNQGNFPKLGTILVLTHSTINEMVKIISEIKSDKRGRCAFAPLTTLHYSTPYLRDAHI